MSNTASSVVMLDAHAKPIYGTAHSDPKVDVLAEKGFAKFVYRQGKTVYATFDRFAGGWRKSSARSSPPSNLAMKLADFLSR
jgi:hypothetical protein